MSEHGYEQRDAHEGATLRAGLYILAVMFLVAALVVPFYRFLARGEAQAQPQPASVVAKPKAAEPSFPRLVSAEPPVLAEFRRQEDALLTSYGWVEKDRGIARIPVAEAIRLVGARGSLPRFAATGLSPAPGAAR